MRNFMSSLLKFIFSGMAILHNGVNLVGARASGWVISLDHNVST